MTGYVLKRNEEAAVRCFILQRATATVQVLKSMMPYCDRCALPTRKSKAPSEMCQSFLRHPVLYNSHWTLKEGEQRAEHSKRAGRLWLHFTGKLSFILVAPFLNLAPLCPTSNFDCANCG